MVIGEGWSKKEYSLYAVLKVYIYLQYGPVAQLVRAPPCHGGGREFESLLGRLRWGLSSAGRASALQAEGHRFEPCRPHLLNKDGFPSGQRGQTVNLLATPSKVRILLHPFEYRKDSVKLPMWLNWQSS